MDNKSISKQINLFSKLMELHGENSFKVKNYSNAAFQISTALKPLKDLDQKSIASIRGIGNSIAEHIIELLNIGKITDLEELLQKTPEGVLDILNIKGIGAKKVYSLWHELGIESIGELQYACEENRLVSLKGFGAKTQVKILEEIAYIQSNKGNLLFAQAVAVASSIVDLFKEKNVLQDRKLEVTAQVLRQEDTIDCISFVTTISYETLLENITTSETFSFLEKKDNIVYCTFLQHISVLFFLADINSFENIFWNTSCTDEFLDAIKAKQLSTKNIFPTYIRSNTNAIEVIENNTLKHIITPEDIKGIIHTHSTYSDGANTIKEMALACIEKKYEYLVLSDHSQTSTYANGLKLDRILQQHYEIDALNKELFPFKIFKSIECDILYDGSLDYEEEVLGSFDIVICSVHQHLKMTEEKAMQRLLTAIENPYTTILGHPSGRLLLSRKPYPIDYKTLIDSCAANDVCIEINANPRRLDIDWKWISYAMQKNVMLSINPDAHTIAGIDDVYWGVLSAQKGLLTSTYNLSSLSLNEFEEYIMNYKRKIGF